MTSLTLSVPTVRADSISVGDRVEVAVNDDGELVYGRVVRVDDDYGLVRLHFAAAEHVPSWKLCAPESLHDVR